MRGKKTAVHHLKLILTILIFFQMSTDGRAYQLGEIQFTPFLTASEQYDNNITYSSHNRLDDFITTLRAGLRSKYEGKNQSGFFTGSLQEELFAHNSGFDNLSEDFSGGYTLDLSPYDRFSINDNFLHAQEPRTFEDEFGRAVGRYDYYQNAFSGWVKHQFNDQWSLKFNYRNSVYDPSLNDQPVSDQHKPGLEMEYEFSSRNQASWFYDYTYRTFSPGGKLTKNTTGLGLRHYFTPQLYFDGKAGADLIQPVYGKHIIRPLYMASLNDQTNQRTLYSIAYTKQFADTPYSQFLFDSWQVAVSCQKDILARLSAAVNVFTGAGTYDGFGVKERLNGAGGQLTYKLTRNTDMVLSDNFTNNKSNLSSDTYKKNVVFLSINIHF